MHNTRNSRRRISEIYLNYFNVNDAEEEYGQRTAVEFIFTSGTVVVSVTQPHTLEALAVTTLVLSRRTF